MLDLRDTLFTYNQIIQTYGDFRIDSRGETVQNNDVFLVILPDDINNSKVVMYVNNELALSQKMVDRVKLSNCMKQ